MTPLEKETQLKTLLKEGGELIVAYSGGVDSSYLMAIAHEVLGNQSKAIIADSPSIPRSELKDAIALAEKNQWPLEVIETSEQHNSSYQANAGDRCYYCKDELFTQMRQLAKENNWQRLAYGAIIDDLSDHRPGAKAAEESQILAPLQDANLSKEDIRILSAKRGLPTASKASFACLASRIPVGEKVTIEKLNQVEMAEEVLKALKLNQYRARHHGEICRIEVSLEDFPTVLENREVIEKEIKKLGYRYVTLDLSGYKTGSTAL